MSYFFIIHRRLPPIKFQFISISNSLLDSTDHFNDQIGKGGGKPNKIVRIYEIGIKITIITIVVIIYGP